MSYFWEKVGVNALAIVFFVLAIVLFFVLAGLVDLGAPAIISWFLGLHWFWKGFFALSPVICCGIYCLLSPVVEDRRVRKFISLYAVMLERRLCGSNDAELASFYGKFRHEIESGALVFWDKASFWYRNNEIKGDTPQSKAIDCLFEGHHRLRSAMTGDELYDYRRVGDELSALRCEARDKKSFVNSYYRVMKEYSIEEYQLHE